MEPGDIEDRGTVRRRTERGLRRLEGLAARRRFRARSRRALRGSLGTAATLATLVKMKIAGTLAGKAAVALAVGLGLAWPALFIGLIGVVGLVLALASLIAGEGGDLHLDGACDCARKDERAERLRHLIAQRREWLAAPSGPAPRLRRSSRLRIRGDGRKNASPVRPALWTVALLDGFPIMRKKIHSRLPPRG